ncbi:hypothetical protein P792_13875 [Asaia sp. SF2.1]|nr:hypothetical protein P792_13875 [Asaia sp. SF2.1]
MTVLDFVDIEHTRVFNQCNPITNQAAYMILDFSTIELECMMLRVLIYTDLPVCPVMSTPLRLDKTHRHFAHMASLQMIRASDRISQVIGTDFDRRLTDFVDTFRVGKPAIMHDADIER